MTTFASPGCSRDWRLQFISAELLLRMSISAIDHGFPLQRLLRLLLFISGALLICWLGLLEQGPGPLIAAALCALWALAGLLNRIPGALGVLAFTAFLIEFSWPLAGAALAVVVLGAVLDFLYRSEQQRDQRLRPLRNELRDAEFQQDLLQRHIERYPILLDSCTLMASAQELGQLAVMLCKQTNKIIPRHDRIGVFYGKGNEIYCSHAINAENHSCNITVDDSVHFGITESRPLILHQGALNHVYIPLRGERRQELGRLSSGVNGVLYVSFQARGVEDEFLIDILRALGRLGGLTLAAVNLMEQARDLALHDDLTGLYGRHEYKRRLNEQIALCRRSSKVLGLIMCDMDHLKRFNDSYGHAAGDEALKAIASHLNQQVPEDGIICRFGGEEFSAFIVADDEAAVESLAARLHQAIRETTLSVNDKLTASIGWSILRDDDSEQDIIQRADDACYLAKDRGRDLIVKAGT